jgi:hypothetical protein
MIIIALHYSYEGIRSMEKTITIAQFRNAIKHLPEDEPRESKVIWYHTQKEHWLGWLASYYGPGGYNRKNWNRDAKFVYNHIVCPDMLVYLAQAIPLRQEILDKVDLAFKTGNTEMEKVGAIRKAAPWAEIYQALWGDREPTFWDRIEGFF